MPITQPPFGDNVLSNQPLARYTSARLGGIADYLYIAKNTDVDDTLAVLDSAWQHNMPVTIIGGGANILVSDQGIRGLTIINRISELQHDNAGNVSASSGTNLIRLARYCQEHGYTGMEWAVGVPGTVGGAIVNNAGAHGTDMSASVSHVVVYEHEHGMRSYSADDLAYAYRYSALKGRDDQRFMVLRATFKLDTDDPIAIQEHMDDFNAYRKRTQPPGASLGSIFKNPKGDYAGRLIEAAGLKGYQNGDVQVSPIHANFIVTLSEHATATQYNHVIRHVQATILQKFGVMLELEIQTLGDWD
jgi:UDP-N-acetylmuramate dehydrogenase